MSTPDHTPAPADEAPFVPPVKIPLILEDTLSVLIMAVLALITLANVIVRYLTNGSFAWTEEISVFLLIVLTMTAGTTAFVRNQHIRIEAWADRGSDTRRQRLTVVCHTIVLLFFILLSVLSARVVYDDYRWGDTSPAIGVPAWWYSIWMPILGTVISLRVLGCLRRALQGTP